MKTTVNLYEFRDAFRSIRPDNFSYEGLAVLFDYLEQLGEDIGEEIELDVIAICCDFSEDTWEGIAENYGLELDPEADDEDNEASVIDYLSNQGAYIGEAKGSIIYRDF